MNAPQLSPADNPAQEELNLAQMAADLWRHRLLLLVLLVAALALASIYLRIATYEYTAALQITPAEQQSGNVPGGLANLGSVVGIDIGGTSGTAFALYGDATRSQPVADALARDERIMRTIFRTQWDAKRGQWVRPPSLLRPVIAPMKAVLGVPDHPWQPPNADRLREHLSARLMVGEDRKRNILTLAYNHRDPEFASHLLRSVSRESDLYLRERALQRATNYVEYLERRLSETLIVELRQSLARALMQYENIRMMASVDSPYAGEEFGEVNVSERPTSPKPVMVLGLAIVGAGAIWFGYVVVALPILAQLRRRRDDAG